MGYEKKVKSIYRTCRACPEQYEGTLDTEEHFYVRCRGGYACIRVADNRENIFNSNTIIAEMNWPDDVFKGVFEKQELFELFDAAKIQLDSNHVEHYGHYKL